MPGACPSCGTEVGADQRFCGDCGSALSTGAPTTFARTATIVTSDLQGSTALGERLDPESLREVLTTYIDEMRLVFERAGDDREDHRGRHRRRLRAPKSAEDDALRAVEAAAETQRAGEPQRPARGTWGVRLIVRTGVASGDVVVGEASAGEHVLTGPTVAIATAMEQNAPAQEVLLAESTFEAARDAIEVEPMRPLRRRARRSRSRIPARLGGRAHGARGRTGPSWAGRICSDLRHRQSGRRAVLHHLRLASPRAAATSRDTQDRHRHLRRPEAVQPWTAGRSTPKRCAT